MSNGLDRANIIVATIASLKGKTFDIEDTGFGDGSVTITIAEVYDTKEEAEGIVALLKSFGDLPL